MPLRDKATHAVSEDHVGSSGKTSLHPLPAREAPGGVSQPHCPPAVQGETLGVNRGTVVKASLAPAKNEVCSLLHLLEWQQRKSAKTEGLNETQSLTAENLKCPGFHQKSLIIPRTRKTTN